MKEIWKAIPKYEGFYEASSWGRIRRMSPYNNTFVGKIIVTLANTHGYFAFTACVNNTKTTMTVHKAVTAAFFGPRPKGLTVNHKNGIKSDNRIENLEYVTHKRNVEHAQELGLVPSQEWRKDPDRQARGERISTCRLTESDVREIVRLSQLGLSDSAISRQFPQVSREAINKITTGKTWKHIIRPCRPVHTCERLKSWPPRCVTCGRLMPWQKAA